ncbi:MAG: hypothetical protein WDN49_17705 [Acetobacteraceae bacterium]
MTKEIGVPVAPMMVEKLPLCWTLRVFHDVGIVVDLECQMPCSPSNARVSARAPAPQAVRDGKRRLVAPGVGFLVRPSALSGGISRTWFSTSSEPREIATWPSRVA